MQEENISRVLVEDKGLKGIISLKDVAFASPSSNQTRRIDEPKGRDLRVLPFTVEEVMKTDIKKVSPKESAAKAAKIMLGEDIGSLVVTDSKNNVQGIITKTDIARFLSKSTS